MTQRKDHYSSRTQINAGAKTGPLLESPPGPLFISGLQPLGRYGTHQETLSRRPEQMYTLKTGMAWEGPLFELNLNKCRAQNVGTIRVTSGTLFMSDLGPLAR